MRAVVFLLFVFVAAQQAHSAYFRDVAALQSLMKQWNNNTSLNWTQQDDTCSGKWEGVTCEDSRVITLSLSSMGLSGTLSDDIGLLSQLQSLDLSYNSDLGGTLTPYIGNLKQLITLILTGCSFSGNIPQELGGLPRLTFLDLSANEFSGGIPASLGNLSSLYWLDVSENLLNGSIPISTDKSPGLDLLVKTRHFHFSRNQLSDSIPEKLFSSKMNLIHIRFEENEFTGSIPASIGLVESLEVIRLDRNSFTGAVPLTFNNLTNVTVLNLAYNLLTGPLPNLSGMNNLQYLDLSKIMFDPSETPAWFSSLQYLNTLEMKSGRIYGQISPKLFRLPMLQHVNLYNNYLNGTLDMGSNISSQLQTVNLQANSISFLLLDDNYRGSLMLEGNPVCIAQYSNTTYCRTPQTSTTYSTSLAKCSSNSCPSDQSLKPGSCYCSYPYIGQLIFRAPYFQDLTNITRFQQLEKSLWTQLILSQGSVSISNIFFTDDSYLQLQIKLFPSTGMYFNRSEISRIGYQLSNQTFRPTPDFGPYFFIASKYSFQVNDSGSEVVSGDHGRSSFSKLKVSGVALGSVLALTGLIFVVIYTFKQAKINIIAASSPPQFKETKCFSFDELMKSTNNFSDVNEIGSGGYGKVYKGTLPYGRMIAIKRLRQGSMQGGIEFRTEIELLSRVHHRNLVELVGFCCEKGEQMLVYELIPNGTLRESLAVAGSGKVQLDWNRRLEIALGSARGLAYLHEHANPPIIHRDVKSTNILLDENLNAKVADFGLSKLVSDIQKGHVSTEVKGTLGYLDPEYYMTQQLTEKSDVYSFGVVMLELLTAKKPIEHGKNTVCEFRTVMERDDGELCSLNEMMGDDGELCSLNEMMDPTIRNEINLTELRRFIHVAMQCVDESAAKRPTMGAVIKEIELMLYEFQEAE